VALPFTFKKYLKAKEEELWKFKYFAMQKYNLQKKKSSKRNQNPSRSYYNSIITNLKFQHKTKISSFKKSSHKNRPIIITSGPKSLKLLYSIMNLNTIYPCLGRQGQQNKSTISRTSLHIRFYTWGTLGVARYI
jgi:hypothetical protein